MDAKALLELSRPVNVVVAALAVVLTAFMTKEMGGGIVLAVASVALITAGGNAINDFYDYEIDIINKPRRPLPSGRLSMEEVKCFSVVMFIMGCAVASFINAPCFLLAVSASLLLYAYALRLKNEGFLGNLTVAGLTGMAIVYAGLSVSGIERILYIATFAFLINLGREIIKDAEDVEGDMAKGARTLAIKYGTKTALLVSIAPLALIIALTPVPYLTHFYNWHYMAIVAVGVDMPLIYVFYRLVAYPTIDTARSAKTIIKVLILIGFAGLYLGL